MFDDKGEIKPYGVGPGDTVFSLGVMSIVLAVVCYYLFAIVDFIFGSSSSLSATSIENM
jgi:hypothetical protein